VPEKNVFFGSSVRHFDLHGTFGGGGGEVVRNVQMQLT
jgi:hypothetical protein